MKKHFLSVVIPFVLFSTSAQADLRVDRGGPSAEYVPAQAVIQSGAASGMQVSGSEVSLREWSGPSTSAPISKTVAFAQQSQDYQGNQYPAPQYQTQNQVYTTYPTTTSAGVHDGVRYNEASGTRTVVTGRVLTEQPVQVRAPMSPQSGLDYVTETGIAPSVLQSGGWANGMPISLALRQVVPSDFKLRENDVLGANLVSWSGDRAWPVVLNELAARNNFVAHIDWTRREVSLAPSMRVPFAAQAPRAMSSNQVVVERQTSVVSVAEAPMITNQYSKDSAYRPTIIKSGSVNVSGVSVAPNGAWLLDPKLTLRENIEAWGERAGWRVVWEGADYPIVAKATFTGDFASPAGPVAKLIAAYETSDQPLVANLTTLDRVLYVKNKYYNQQEVTPTSAGEMSPELFGQKN